MMPADSNRGLTDRQKAVMERVDRRVPIKVIAAELGVSDTRINQHIRALKNHYGATSLGELVELHRIDQGTHDQGDQPVQTKTEIDPDDATLPLSEDVYRNSQLPSSVFGFDDADRDKATALEFNDVMPLIEKAPWLRPGEPKVVPGMLDGEHAVTLRLAAIVGIAFGILAAVVLTATAAIMISDALDERASVPVDEQGFT